jgi:Protein of Unknown function (DUF2784)
VASLRTFAIAADSVLVGHALFALFAVLGAFLLLVDARIAFIHIPVVVWSSLVNLAHWTCPLTPLEKRCRIRAGQSAYEGGWIRHYIEPMVRPLGMPRRLEYVAGFSVLAWNVFLYGLIWRARGIG